MKHREYTSDRQETRPFHVMRVTARALRNIGMISLFLLMLASRLSSQEVAPAQRTVPAAESPFAGWNDSLERTADGVLAEAGSVRLVANPSKQADIHAAGRNSLHEVGLRPLQANGPLSRLASLRPLINPILREAGIPTELAAVVLVESGGDAMALSPKGARGLWQLMPDTARRYGLIVDNTEDDRLDIEKSTRAAARYLGDLYSEFGSWPLALAAYNTGEDNLQHAIDRSRSTDFNVLSSLRLLPLETRKYVPAVFAAETRLINSPAEVPSALSWDRQARTVFAVAESSTEALQRLRRPRMF